MTLKVGDVFPIEGGIITGLNETTPTVVVTGVIFVTVEQALKAEKFHWETISYEKDGLTKIQRDAAGWNQCKILDANYDGEQNDGHERQQPEGQPTEAEADAGVHDSKRKPAADKLPAKDDAAAPDAGKPAGRSGARSQQRAPAKAKDTNAGGKPAPEKGKGKPAARVRKAKAAGRSAKKKRKA